MKIKKLHGISYITTEDNYTFEIFDTKEQAKLFARDNDGLFMFTANFDLNSIYKEDDGKWNYDDNSAVFDNYKIVECFICGNCNQ